MTLPACYRANGALSQPGNRLFAARGTGGILGHMTLRAASALPTVLSRVRLTGREPLPGGLTRVFLAGAELSGSALLDPGLAPDARLKLFLPDPATGRLAAPTIGPAGEILRPATAVSISRDFTPADPRPAGRPGDEPTVAIDAVAAGPAAGPALSWLLGAELGAEAVLADPRRSLALPTAEDADEVLLIADETGFAAAAGWLRRLDPAIRVSAVFLGEDDGFEDYFSPAERGRAAIDWLYRVDGPGQLAEAVASVSLPERGFAWAHGEAGELAPIRRWLLGRLPADRVDVTGTWRRGQVNHDPDAPL